MKTRDNLTNDFIVVVVIATAATTTTTTTTTITICPGTSLGRWTCDLRVAGSSPGHDTAWLFLRQVTVFRW